MRKTGRTPRVGLHQNPSGSKGPWKMPKSKVSCWVLLRPFLISLFRHISNQCCFSSHQFLKLFFQLALIFQEMEWLNTKLPSTILHRDLFFKHLKSKFSHTINHYGIYHNYEFSSLKKNSIFNHCVFTYFSKAPNWGQMLNYVFPITPFFFDVFNEFQLFCHGSVPKLFGYLSFWNVSVIKNRVGYFAFTFGVYVVTHSDRLLTLHVAY